MKHEYKMTIGIEVHAEISTKNKVFSKSINNLSDKPNKNINEVDLGMPGTLPILNLDVVEAAIKLGKALNMIINPCLKFNRKIYFHYDLPKSYQITQFKENAIAHDGYINIKDKTIGIEEFHIEEDTAKQTRSGLKNFLDYNRCGVCLIEIVSKPEINSAKEAIEYLNALKRILVFLEINDGKLENGSFRADVNISVSKSNVLGSRVEIKNLNSFSNIEKAIEYEYDRQCKLLENGQEVIQETRKWNEYNGETEFMRQKANPEEYYYTNEWNILPINIQSLIDKFREYKYISIEDIKNELASHEVSENIINILINDYLLYKNFIYIANQVEDYHLASVWLMEEMVAILKESNRKIDDIKNEEVNILIDLIKMIKNNSINSRQAKEVLVYCIKELKSPKVVVEKLGFAQITDESAIKRIVQEVIDINIEMIKQNIDRPERVEKFIIGMVMKATKGQANPILVKKIFDELLPKNEK